MYHFVDYTPPPGRWSAGLTVPVQEFGQQMDYLAGHGFHPVLLRDVYAAMGGGPPLPARPVAITFDDGNEDNFTIAFPILKAHGFVATFFVITDRVGRGFKMSWSDLETMQDAGMDIESHTVSHPDLTLLDAGRLEQELAESRAALVSHLQNAPVALAYPAGAYNARVIKAARAAGYLLAVTTHHGTVLDPAQRYSWPRVRVFPKIGLKGFGSSLD